MAIGRQIRLSRILNDGKMLCIPMDHGITNGPIAGLEDVYEFIYRCENSGVTSVHINIGAKEEPEMLQKLGIISDKCNEWNIPLIAMMYPRGENIKNPYDVEIVSHVARIGAEAGADIVKTVYTGDRDSFKKVVRT